VGFLSLSARDLAEIERAHARGLSSREILEVLKDHGEHLTEATLRKYVQLGLLPRSTRVGEKGKHRGSRGIYPVEVIRRIDEIRRAMGDGETLEELARVSAVRGKLAAVRTTVGEVLTAAETDLLTRELDRSSKTALRSRIAELSKAARSWLRDMEKWTQFFREAEARAVNGKAGAKNHSAGGSKMNARHIATAAKRPRRPGGV
jgi:DNA-binding transcriptional MerR regulator